jgi:DNA-binding phage protein
MRQSGQKFGQLSRNLDSCPNRGSRVAAVISGDCAARVVVFLRALHAAAPGKIAERVEAECGIAAGTVRKWLDRSSAPSFSAYLALIHAYGPEFLAAVMDRPPAWITTAARVTAHERVTKQIAELEAEAERLASEMKRTAGEG